MPKFMVDRISFSLHKFNILCVTCSVWKFVEKIKLDCGYNHRFILVQSISGFLDHDFKVNEKITQVDVYTITSRDQT